MAIIVTIAVLLSLAVTAYALYIEPTRFRTTRARVEIKRKLPQPLEILHISDLHLMAHERTKIEFLRGLHARPVDLVLVTGDIIEDDSGIECCVEILSGFRTRYGVFVVFGAHDHWDTRLWNVVRDLSLGGYRKGAANDFERFRNKLELAGVVCLENESCRLGLGDKTDLWFVGVGDIFAGLDDFGKALEGVPDDAFRILLAHSVESPEELAARRFDAVFAGHSHGGQVRLPFLGAVITRSSLKREFASGVFAVGGTPFHINNGVGTGKWTRFRFLCPPEVTYIELFGDG